MIKSSIFDAKTIISSLVGIIGTFAAIMIVSIFSRPVVSEAQDSNVIQWEYLTISYAQLELYDPDSELTRYEIISSGDTYYSELFASILYEGCDPRDDNFDTCVAENFLGQEAVLDMLGIDRWELVEIDNISTQFSYQLDLTFKRPLLEG
jgi:hypothetical protein